jgi:effector-binding domain-containing protein
MTAPVVSEQIEMTAPVLSDKASLAFVMPEGYTTETAPEPLNEEVKIVEVPERLVAALRFSGRWTKSSFNAKSKELLNELATANLKTKGNAFAMLYNAPFTPWFMRRNEVAIEVELEPS